MHVKGVLPLVAAAAAAAFWPGGAAAGTAASVHGVVVARQHGTLLVAAPGGLVRAERIRLGWRAATPGARVALAGGRAVVLGRARAVIIRGIVVRRIGTTLFLSSNRHLLAIHGARRLADAGPTTAPPPGAVVTTQVRIAGGRLDEEDEDEIGRVAAASLQVQATIAAVAPGLVTLNVQGQSLTVPLPAGLTLPASLVGQTATIALSLSSGDDEQGDDDQGDDHGGDRHGGDDGGGDR